MSKENEFVRIACEKGYTVDKTGQVFNPRGKPIKGYIQKKKTKQKDWRVIRA